MSYRDLYIPITLIGNGRRLKQNGEDSMRRKPRACRYRSTNSVNTWCQVNLHSRSLISVADLLKRYLRDNQKINGLHQSRMRYSFTIRLYKYRDDEPCWNWNLMSAKCSFTWTLNHLLTILLLLSVSITTKDVKKRDKISLRCLRVLLSGLPITWNVFAR